MSAAVIEGGDLLVTGVASCWSCWREVIVSNQCRAQLFPDMENGILAANCKPVAGPYIITPSRARPIVAVLVRVPLRGLFLPGCREETLHITDRPEDLFAPKAPVGSPTFT